MISNVMEYRIISILLLSLASCSFSSRPSVDYGWEEPLPESITVLEGDNVTLTYRYTSNSDVTGNVKVELSHYIAGNNYENVLIVANDNPLNQQPEVIHELTSGRVIINASDHRFTFTLLSVKLNQWGRYLTDVTFSSGTTLYHWIDVVIFQRPSFKRTPPKDITSNENGTATFEWSPMKSIATPEVESVRITYRNCTLVHHREVDHRNQWLTTYSDEYENRISYAASPKFRHILFTIWDLRIEDSGLYTLKIIYKNQVAELENSTSLVVTTGYRWAVTPTLTSFLIAQRKNRLEFQADIRTGNTTSLKFDLYKLSNELDEVLLAEVVVNVGTTKHHVTSLRGNWKMEFNVTSTILVITITNPTCNDSGWYVLKLTRDAQSVVLVHAFDLVVFNEADLNPIIKTTPDSSKNSTVFCISIAVSNPAPKPDIVVYIGNDTNVTYGSLTQKSSHTEPAMTVYTRVNETSRLQMCVARSTQSDLVFSIVLIYENTAAVVRIQKETRVPQAQPEYGGVTRSNTDNQDEGSPQNDTFKISVICFILSAIIFTILLFIVLSYKSKILSFLRNCKKNRAQFPDNRGNDVGRSENEDEPLANDSHHELSSLANIS